MMSLYSQSGLLHIYNHVISDLNVKKEIGVGLCCKHNGLIIFNPNNVPPESLVDSSDRFIANVFMAGYSPFIYNKRLAEIIKSINTLSANPFMIISGEYPMYMYPISLGEKKHPDKYIGAIQVSKTEKKRFAISFALAELLELEDKLCIAFVADERTIIVGQELDVGTKYKTYATNTVKYTKNKNLIKQIEKTFNLGDTKKTCVFKCCSIDITNHVAVLTVPDIRGDDNNEEVC